MVDNKYGIAYSQVLEILKHISEEDYNKIMEILVDVNGSDNGIDEAIKGVVNSIGKTKSKASAFWLS